MLPGGLLTFFFFSESRFLDEDDAKGVELKAANELLVQNAMLGNQGFQKLMLNNRLKMYNLASRMFNFLKNAYDLQAKHLNHTSNAKEEFICPLFFSSVHGFAWQVLNKFCLKNFELRSLNWPSGKSFGTSHFECEVLSYLQFAFSNSQLKSVFTSAFGSPLVNGRRLDGVIETDSAKIAILVNGEIYHYSPKLTPKQLDYTLSTFDFSRSWRNVSKNWDDEVQDLFKGQHDFTHVFGIWQGQWQQIKKRSPELRAFLACPLNQLQHPLHVNEALKNGIVESFRLTWEKKYNKDEHFFQIDCCSQFLHISSGFFSTGVFRRYSFQEIGNDLSFCPKSKHFFFRNQICSGLIKMLVYPHNSKELFPCALFNYEGHVFAPLCRTCCIERNQKKCQHTKIEEKCFITTCTFLNAEDIAGSQSYTILKVYEIILSSKRERLFADYKNFMSKLITQVSGFPRHCNTAEQKTEYCNQVNSFLNLPPKDKLKVGDIKLNKPYKNLLKTLACSGFGFLAKKPKNISKICNNEFDMQATFLSGKVTNFSPIASNTCLVESSPSPKKNHQFSPLTLCEVYDLSRRHILQTAKKLTENGMTIANINIDSISYISQKKMSWNGSFPKFLLSPGGWKLEHDKEITAYFGFNTKKSLTVFEDNSCKLKNPGCYLNKENVEYITSQFKEGIKLALENKKRRLPMQKKNTKKLVYLSNTICQKRVHLSTEMSVPYGYCDM